MGGKKSYKARLLQAQQEKAYRREVYFKKLEEYKQKSLDELKEIFNQKGDKRIGGIYKLALIEAVNIKLKEQAIKEGRESEKPKEESETTTENQENTD